MADISALYPQPTKPDQGALSSDPAKVIGLMGALNANKLFNATFDAESQRPQAALEGQNIQNRTAQIEQDNKVQQLIAHHFGTAETPEDMHGLMANAAVMFPTVPAARLQAVADIARRDPKGFANGVKTLRLMGVSPESMVSRVTGPPTQSGEPTSVDVPSATRGGAMTTGMAPGETEIRAAPASRAERLQASAGTTQQYHADLENLRSLSKTIEIGGPTVDAEKKLNQLGSRFGLSITMTPDQLKSVEEFDKIANQISLNQSTQFHGSDAGLHTVVGANPSTSMSRYGREGVIDMLQGNQDAVDTARKAWLRARGSGEVKAQDFDVFMERLGQELDPRVFQFNRMGRANQQKFLDNMDKEDLADFEEKYKKSIERKWVKPLKGAESAKQ